MKDKYLEYHRRLFTNFLYDQFNTTTDDPFESTIIRPVLAPVVT